MAWQMILIYGDHKDTTMKKEKQEDLVDYTESEQSLYRFFGICKFIAAVPFSID
jgi:hypothetical protein